MSTTLANGTLFDTDKPKSRGGITPRDYQARTHDECFRLWDQGTIGVLARMATGTGKTLVASLIADTWLRRGENYRVMVLSYETQLVWQFAEEVEDFLGIKPGIEMADDTAKPHQRVVVASRQSLQKHKPPTKQQVDELAAYGVCNIGAVHGQLAESYLRHLRKGGVVDVIVEDVVAKNAKPEAADGAWSRLHKFDWRYHWLIVHDEAHRHARKLLTVGHIADWFERNPFSRRLGLTATPRRADSVSIGDNMFPGIAIDYPLFSTAKACSTKDGWSVPYVQKYIEVEGVDFKRLERASDGDFDEAALERALGEEATLAKLVNPLLDLVGDRRTLVFCPGVEMAKDVARYINARVQAKCECGISAWYPSKLVGDGAECKCGRFIASEHVTKSGEHAKELDGGSPYSYRKEVYAAYEQDKFQFLCVCGLCVAKGTLVLTDCGEVPIEQVTTDMKLWDGVEFVSHDGAISKGEQTVIQYAGLTATGDHHVWTDDGWERFAACKQQRIAIRVSAVGGKAVRESCGYYRGDHSTWKESPFRFRSALRRVRKALCKVLQRVKVGTVWLQAMRKILRCAELAVDAMSLCKETVRESARRVLRGLRCAWGRVPLCFAGSNGPMGNGEFGPAHGVDFGSQGQQPSLRTWQHSLGQPDGTGEQQETTPPRIQEKVKVYDILNAGPRHRFTANGLIVSNCREGFNSPAVSCVALFRPVSKKASSLAEQMKGRSCRPLREIARMLHTLPDAEARCRAIAESAKPNALIVDLVGATGLADCASTVEIYADGLPDEVKQRAEQLLAKQGLESEANVEAVIEQAKREADEAKQRVIREREAAERKAKDEYERRALADAQVKYTEHDVGYGSQIDPNAASSGQLKFLAVLGMEVNAPISKRQAGRLINLLKLRTPVAEAARLTGLGGDQWEPANGPSPKFRSFMFSQGIPVERAKTGYDARQLTDAKLEPEKFVQQKVAEIQSARDGQQLDGLGKDLALVRGVLPQEQWDGLVSLGKAKRHQLAGHGDSYEG